MRNTTPSPEQQAAENKPEFTSVEAFAEYLCDDERETFTFEEVAELSRRTRRSIPKLLRELADWGLRYTGRPHASGGRGFLTPSSRWLDCPTHATSGADQILGFAGRDEAEVRRCRAREGK